MDLNWLRAAFKPPSASEAGSALGEDINSIFEFFVLKNVKNRTAKEKLIIDFQTFVQQMPCCVLVEDLRYALIHKHQEKLEHAEAIKHRIFEMAKLGKLSKDVYQE